MGEPSIRLSRVRQILRVRGELRELGVGTEAARQHLMNSALSLVGAVMGAMAFDVRGGRKGGVEAATLAGFDDHTLPVFTAHVIHGRNFNPVCREVMQRGAERSERGMITTSNQEVVDKREWEMSAWVNEYVRPARADHYLSSVMWVAPGTTEGIGIMRAAGDRPFSDEDRHVAHLLRDGMGRFFGEAREQTRLAPRVQQTLEYLLTGASDKEIAAHLGISGHTVRQYVKTIFRAHRVSSRGQLIARLSKRAGA